MIWLGCGIVRVRIFGRTTVAMMSVSAESGTSLGPTLARIYNSQCTLMFSQEQSEGGLSAFRVVPMFEGEYLGWHVTCHRQITIISEAYYKHLQTFTHGASSSQPSRRKTPPATHSFIKKSKEHKVAGAARTCVLFM